MTRDEMLQALDALGAASPTGAELIVIGGAAGILCRWISRATMDIDIAFAEPRLSALRPQIEEVAEDLGLPERWLNDGAKGFAQVLPPDFRERLVHVGTFGRLVVHAISRRDFILMKLAALRAEDVADLAALQPTADEVEFVRAQLPRIARFDPRKAHLVELYLGQGESS